ncbi:MAG: hypothetical protein ED859_09445 [Desulfuromonadales bacterium]|nr:MAG: hypothetical protein ED859_09445 [Desulfuromonadales bacterium]
MLFNFIDQPPGSMDTAFKGCQSSTQDISSIPGWMQYSVFSENIPSQAYHTTKKNRGALKEKTPGAPRIEKALEAMYSTNRVAQKKCVQIGG